MSIPAVGLLAVALLACGAPATPPPSFGLEPRTLVLPARADRDQAGEPMFVDVVDESGLLLEAAPAAGPFEEPADGEAIGGRQLDVPGRVLIVWHGSPADVSGRLVIAPDLARISLADGRRPGADAVPVLRAIVLRFSRPVDFDRVDLQLIVGPAVEPEKPGLPRERIEEVALERFGGPRRASVVDLRLDTVGILAAGFPRPERLAWAVSVGPAACPIPCSARIGVVLIDAATGEILYLVDYR